MNSAQTAKAIQFDSIAPVKFLIRTVPSRELQHKPMPSSRTYISWDDDDPPSADSWVESDKDNTVNLDCSATAAIIAAEETVVLSDVVNDNAALLTAICKHIVKHW